MKNFRICGPLSRTDETLPLIEAGVKEIYTGILPEGWNDEYGLVCSPTRRYGRSAHLPGLEELEVVVRDAHSHGVEVYLAQNERYSAEQEPGVVELVKGAEAIGVDAAILGDVAFLLALKKAGVKMRLFMGTGGNIFNTSSGRFFMEQGISRVILPRHIRIQEIRAIHRNLPELELESFVFRGLCPYIDGMCRFQHGINQMLEREPVEDIACGLDYKVNIHGDCPPEIEKSLQDKYTRRQSFTGCGLCALYDLAELGIRSFKIVGREMPSREKIEGVEVVKKMTDLLETGISRDDFFDACHTAYEEFYEERCTPRACYYPELWR
ncbi:MAG: U32 family peptidase [Candidatus Eremiobacteraeota bacterium]|nr:U32 family peptidase [Candidatus Eremiobacteraeota bacterium]